MRLQGKVSVVTGGARGLGGCMCQLFAKEGARVIAVDLGEMTYQAEGVEFYKLNITDVDGCKQFYDSVIEKYGKIDILVNNAGITRDAMTRKMTDEMWDIVIDVDLKGLFNLTRYIGPQMEAKGKGFVVSDLTITGGPVPWSVYYATPETLAREDNLCGRFTQGLQMAQTWLREHDGYDCRQILARNWPKVELDKAMALVNEYCQQGMRPETVRIQEEELNRWQKFLVEGHVIDGVIPYEEIVDPRPFRYAAEKLGL